MLARPAGQETGHDFFFAGPAGQEPGHDFFFAGPAGQETGHDFFSRPEAQAQPSQPPESPQT